MASNYIRLPGEAPPVAGSPMGDARKAQAQDRMTAKSVPTVKTVKPPSRSASALKDRLSVEQSSAAEMPKAVMRPVQSAFSVRDYSKE